ncbi:MAG: hypothetical protein HDR21_10535 [Lachnospiraceae bacterium]|nr:hypothetical protein [Lachnospiraceae bacterium]MBD5481343.1 hypothetical protein [Lachnospiraceae bacterium]
MRGWGAGQLSCAVAVRTRCKNGVGEYNKVERKTRNRFSYFFSPAAVTCCPRERQSGWLGLLFSLKYLFSSIASP